MATLTCDFLNVTHSGLGDTATLSVADPRMTHDGTAVILPEEVSAPVDESGTAVFTDVDPGPVVVTLRRRLRPAAVFPVVVPDEPEVTLADLLEGRYPYTPAQISAARAAAATAKEMAREAEAAAIGAREAADEIAGAPKSMITVGPPGDDAVENVASIQAAINTAAESGGGTVILAPGATYPLSGTIHMRENTRLDLNRATLFAIDNAAFDEINLGTRTVDSESLYNPSGIKPIVSIHGQNNGARLSGVSVVNGTIDGNGRNQPDEGSYANIVIIDADGTVIEDVRSVRARPGLTINTGADGVSGPNTGRRAFCLLVGRATGTVVSRGYFSDSGYDAIGLRQGALDTQFVGVHAAKAWKGSIQIALGARSTKIIGGIWDNTAGAGSSSHAIFTHSAVDVTVTGATIRAEKGSCVSCFGTAGDGFSESIVIKDSVLEHHGSSNPVVNLGNGYVRNFTLDNVVSTKTGSTGAFTFTNGPDNENHRFNNVRVSQVGASSAFSLTKVKGVTLSDCSVDIGSRGNACIVLNGASDVQITGGTYRQAAGVSMSATSCDGLTIAQIKPICTDSFLIKGDCTNVNVLDNDLAGVTNANKLRLYGAASGIVRGNRGAATEASGRATIPASSTSVTVPHGLWQGTSSTSEPRTDRKWLPSDFQVSFGGPTGSAGGVWVSEVTPTSVTFTASAAPGVPVDLVWSARMDRST